jgi:hypothetical protein
MLRNEQRPDFGQQPCLNGVLVIQLGDEVVIDRNSSVFEISVIEHVLVMGISLNKGLARILGARWNNESPEVREQFTHLADELKKEHAIKQHK